jgi:hypothetical protein
MEEGRGTSGRMVFGLRAVEGNVAPYYATLFPISFPFAYFSYFQGRKRLGCGKPFSGK